MNSTKFAAMLEETARLVAERFKSMMNNNLLLQFFKYLFLFRRPKRCACLSGDCTDCSGSHAALQVRHALSKCGQKEESGYEFRDDS